ncbi:cytochrome P450 6k1-like isoform X1 [Diabrotica undecimpunctata]|uniref:cytochrome P450 6k1-like isoform X1 n=1 Tax=Diabrotica undecimpunctata TaxID=50387 RepID=UPI003B6402DE
MWGIFLLVIIGLLVLGVYQIKIYLSQKQKYWQKRGVFSPEVTPIIGHFLDVFLCRQNIVECIKQYYDKIDKPYFGLYVFDEPFFVVKDAVLAKHILVKDFNHFRDRNVASPDHNLLIQNFMFNQKNPTWKRDRSNLTPIFSPTKLKEMFPIIKTCGLNFMDYLKRYEGILDAKEAASRFSTDVISQCAFGIDSHNYEKDISTFQKYGNKCFDLSFRNSFCQTIYVLKPQWVNKLKLEFLPTDASNYLCNIVLNTMKIRKDTERRNDVIDALKDMKENNQFDDRDSDIVISGIVFQFFLAGYESTSTTIAFLLYNLAKNICIQEKLRNEIRCSLKKHGSLTYDAIMDIPYLDMCVDESLRMYPVLPFYERKCNEDYHVPNSEVIIEKGKAVLISSYAFHMDEKYFPNPNIFDPERFRHKIDHTNGIFYMPFGEGPRKCLGGRLGKLTTKIAVLLTVINFEITPCDRTPEHIEFEPKSLVLQSKVGVPLMFKRINIEESL